MYLSAIVYITLGLVVGYLLGRLRRPTLPPANGAPQVVVMVCGPITEQKKG